MNIEQLKKLSFVVAGFRPNTPEEQRYMAVALQVCANLIDAELAKKDELESENDDSTKDA